MEALNISKHYPGIHLTYPNHSFYPLFQSLSNPPQFPTQFHFDQSNLVHRVSKSREDFKIRIRRNFRIVESKYYSLHLVSSTRRRFPSAPSNARVIITIRIITLVLVGRPVAFARSRLSGPGQTF